MIPDDLPATAAWIHSGGRSGFESVALRREPGGWLVVGSTTAVEDGAAWWQSYEIRLDGRGLTERVHVRTRVASEPERTLALVHDGAGSWTVDGVRTDELDGCLDVDLEASALTNALPVRRLLVAGRAAANAPAAFVPVHAPDVRRLEQRYVRAGGTGDGPPAFDYTAPAFDFAARITYDGAGLVLDYPGIARRSRP
ncbi:putative glycolipid-binding domain-containing protein [Amnibacterium sp. CER49]|uniref:putative glycolipid-binding domain-containing protein n=1 Tax=Amnibacterium sp. CER49 TaxID=3039161 RepID=UPI002446D7AF|nr:putative glycolipid-binding domain-containing protein [Amnibacterium sp. CER49]MDH2444843.1 putative glycolipid-binding domain-containing protein [Amnibacterium sp. CER49]